MASLPILKIPSSDQAQIRAARSAATSHKVNVPETLEGNYSLVTLVALSQEATDEQIAQLMSAIEAVSGVVKAIPFIGSSAIYPASEAPAGHEVKCVIEQKWVLEPEPIPELVV